MSGKLWAATLGLSAVAGAVAILAMPKNNTARKLAEKAADKVEDATWKLTDKMSRQMDL